MNEFTISEPIFFYCYRDEENFFRWLEAIPGVEKVSGGAKGLTVRLDMLGRSEWIDLIGLMARYSLDLSCLKDVLLPGNEEWVQDSDAYWYKLLFPDQKNQ